MNGFCNTPGHQDRPARLYPCGWRCEGCAPGSSAPPDHPEAEGRAA